MTPLNLGQPHHQPRRPPDDKNDYDRPSPLTRSSCIIIGAVLVAAPLVGQSNHRGLAIVATAAIAALGVMVVRWIADQRARWVEVVAGSVLGSFAVAVATSPLGMLGTPDHLGYAAGMAVGYGVFVGGGVVLVAFGAGGRIENPTRRESKPVASNPRTAREPGALRKIPFVGTGSWQSPAVGTAVLLVAGALIASQIGPSDEESELRATLNDLRVAQEAYARNNAAGQSSRRRRADQHPLVGLFDRGYARSLSALDGRFTVPQMVTVNLVEVSSSGWVGTAAHQNAPGLRCAIRVGPDLSPNAENTDDGVVTCRQS